MKTYRHNAAPLLLSGVPFFYETGALVRLPAPLREELPKLAHLACRCPGSRIGFRTDAASFTVRMKLASLTVDIGMSLFAGSSINVMIGERQNARFAGLVNPTNYEQKEFEKTFHKAPVMEEVTLWLPRNEEIEEVTVTFPDEAKVEGPTPYRYGKALFYGSSITEGGCCCNVTNNYIALLSRWLDLDFYNFGFSGNARGELSMADYINTIDMDYFILDYDHNAPNAAHLRATHEPFFRRIREKHPTMPILLLSCPNFDHTPEAEERRAIIRATYEKAVSAGDRHVWYIDGETFFGSADRTLCTIDTVHPNDLGFYRMAETILPVMKEMLGIS